MDHDFYKEKISAYFDGELKNEVAVMVAEHLKVCEECQQELEKLQQFDEFIKTNSELSESEYWEKSAQRIESAIGTDNIAETTITDIRPVAWKGLGWKLTTAVASIILITFIAIYEKDMSDEMYELTEPDSATVSDPTSETDKKTSILKEEVGVEGKTSKGYLNVETSSEPEKDEYSEISSEEEIDRVKLRGEKADEVSLKSNFLAPRVATEDTPDKDVASGEAVSDEEVQAISNRINESEKQIRSGQDDKISSDELKLSDESGKPITLAEWQNKRDLLLSSLNDIDRLEIKQSYAKKKSLSRTSVSSIGADKVLILLECYYNIALLTNDTFEYNQSVEEIKKYSISKNDEYKKQAGYYIEKLSESGDKK